MFNFSARRQAIEALGETVAKHEGLREETASASERLFEQRRRAARTVIERVEAYVSSLANSPKDFDKTVSEYRIVTDRFEHHVERLQIDSIQTAKVGSATATTGAVAGLGVAALGPTTAMAVATTFGTASTGAAISTLSGAAATNAALAWLGGGALAAGGGGMAAGNALLALAGPVGWSIAGTAILGSAAFLHFRNRRYAEEATEIRMKVEVEIRSLVAATKEIDGLAQSTAKHSDGCISDIKWLTENAPEDYGAFDARQKERLVVLINHIRSLGKLLNTQVTF